MITRRAAAQAVAASLLAAPGARAQRRSPGKHPDVLVIGAGSFGAWTAYQLMRRGHRVTLLDAYGAGNSLSSSGDQSRITRCAYGSREIYSRWAAQSRAQWQALEWRTRIPVFVPSGVLCIAPRDQPFAAETVTTLQRLKLRFEALTPADCMRRFPQFRIAESEAALFEPEAGTLLARGALQALVAEMQAQGLDYRLDRIRPLEGGPEGPGRLERIVTLSGEELHAAQFVFACGPWLPKLFPEVIGSRIAAVRAEAYFLRIPPGSREYEPQVMPTWFDVAEPDAFGFPNLEARGCKVAVDAIAPPTDPDSQDRRPTAPFADAVRAYLARRLPGLAEAPFVEERVCQYEMTANEHYILDRHPRHDNVWIAGGGSGHGFKNGPSVGEYVADRLEGRPGALTEFSLASRSPARS